MRDTARVAVTGATGFVGAHLSTTLRNSGISARRLVRHGASVDEDTVVIGDIVQPSNEAAALKGIDTVVHCAARVHVMREVEDDPLSAFRQVNVGGTEQMLRMAARQHVKRFIYLSTVKVHGEMTTGRPFSVVDSLAPCDPYSQSKAEAEHLVEDMGSTLGFETVIIRPPLVYGPGVRGNFERLLGLIEKGVPLPFGLLDNARSMVSVENLCGLVAECVINSAASNQKFLVSDNRDLSTSELMQLIATSMHRTARLLPVPKALLGFAAKIVGQSEAMSRLTGSLQVNIDHTMQTLDWQPPASVPESLKSTVRWYQEQKNYE